jgi:hypothetical protein
VEAAKFGICSIVPPEPWAPPFAAGAGLEALRFPAAQQAVGGPGAGPAAEVEGREQAHSLSSFKAAADWARAMHFGEAGGGGSGGGGAAQPGRPRGRRQQQQQQEEEEVGNSGSDSDDGSKQRDAGGAKWAAARAAAAAKRAAARGQGGGAAAPLHASARAVMALAANGFGGRHQLQQQRRAAVDAVEAEFWRLVEAPGRGYGVRALVAPGLDATGLRAGFPCGGAAAGGGGSDGEEEADYAGHPWNLKRLPASAGSVLRHARTGPAAALAAGLAPRLRIGSCLASAGWRAEELGLYSVSYLHLGAPRVWYG